MSEIKVDKDTRNIADLQHNHFTRDVKEWGECPACDDYHKSELIRKYKSRITQQEEIIKVLEILCRETIANWRMWDDEECDADEALCFLESKARSIMSTVERIRNGEGW